MPPPEIEVRLEALFGALSFAEANLNLYELAILTDQQHELVHKDAAGWTVIGAAQRKIKNGETDVWLDAAFGSVVCRNAAGTARVEILTDGSKSRFLDGIEVTGDSTFGDDVTIDKNIKLTQADMLETDYLNKTFKVGSASAATGFQIDLTAKTFDLKEASFDLATFECELRVSDTLSAVNKFRIWSEDQSVGAIVSQGIDLSSSLIMIQSDSGGTVLETFDPPAVSDGIIAILYNDESTTITINENDNILVVGAGPLSLLAGGIIAFTSLSGKWRQIWTQINP